MDGNGAALPVGSCGRGHEVLPKLCSLSVFTVEISGVRRRRSKDKGCLVREFAEPGGQREVKGV